MSDWEYLEKAHKGDEEAWKELIRRYNSTLVRMVCLITGSMAVARELTQETFVRLLNCNLKHHEGSLKSYLTTIAYRLALKEKQKIKSMQNLVEFDYADDSPGALEGVILEERNRILLQVIDSLGEDHRDILVLRFYGGNSYKEIAGILKLPEGTVKSRIFYAVKECQRLLTEKGMMK